MSVEKSVSMLAVMALVSTAALAEKPGVTPAQQKIDLDRQEKIEIYKAEKALPADVLTREKIKMQPASTEMSCSAMFEDLLAWTAEKRTGPGLHRVGAKMASVKIRDRRTDAYPWGHGSYAEGGFGWGGSHLGGRFKVLFSDRTVGAGGNRFAHSKSDIQDVKLHLDGRIEIQLRSWGDALLYLRDVTCYRDGFVTGIKREGNGVSLVSFVLRKEVATPGSHPSNWP